MEWLARHSLAARTLKKGPRGQRSYLCPSHLPHHLPWGRPSPCTCCMELGRSAQVAFYSLNMGLHFLRLCPISKLAVLVGLEKLEGRGASSLAFKEMYIWQVQLRNSGSARGHGWEGLTVPSAEPSPLCQELANVETAGQWSSHTHSWALTKPIVLNSLQQNPEFQTIQTYHAPEPLNALGSTSRIVSVPGMTDLLCRNHECLLLPHLLLWPHPSGSMSRVIPLSRTSSLNSPVKLPPLKFMMMLQRTCD